MESVQTQCCVVGGGPAGVILGVLLARAGVQVCVLEKYPDFFRDFRGDTIHPSTMQVMDELGILDEFLKVPHQKTPVLAVRFGDYETDVADFTHLPTRAKFIALMPQWDFLNFLAAYGRRYKTFDLRMQTEVTGVIEEGGRVVGVRANGPAGPLEIRADLVVAADGRHSTVREVTGFKVEELGAPMDVLWFRISRSEKDPSKTTFFFEAGHIVILLDRGDYWQIAYIIPKGGFDQLKAGGLAAFHAQLLRIAPFFASRIVELKDWDAIKLLSVQVDRIETWHRPGLLLIGDAAHAMSPIGGVGVNLAVQDGVATANILAAPLKEGRVTEANLAAVQARREFPVKLTQKAQVVIQNKVISPLLSKSDTLKPPLPIRLLKHIPALRRVPARLIGIGVRPEHVATGEDPAALAEAKPEKPARKLRKKSAA